MERLDYKAFREQEQALVLLNLGVLAGLFAIHAGHFSIDGGTTAEKVMLMAFGLRFLWQVGDFLWLQDRDRALSPRSVEMLARLSLVIHLAFAWLVTLFGDEERMHYVVLMALPVAAAGFRSGWMGASAVWATAAVHAFFEVWFYRLSRPPLEMVEFFEAATIALLYLVVGVVTLLLARQLEEREKALEQSLCKLEETREAMVAAERQAAIGRLSRAMAHELRNPVGMIASSIAVWRERGQQDCKGAIDLLDVVDGEVRRLEKLTLDFLEFARERRVELRKADLRDVLEVSASMARAQAAKGGVELRLEEGESLSGCLDPFAVEQVLLNLLKNGIEATPPGGCVRLRGRRLPRGMEVLVESGGPAIPAGFVERLFQPFETTKPAGTGLGLAISQSIARAHGGELALVANEEGRVCFALTLPECSKEEGVNGAGPCR